MELITSLPCNSVDFEGAELHGAILAILGIATRRQ